MIFEYDFVNLGLKLKKMLEKKSEYLMKKYDLRKIELDILFYLYREKDNDIAKDIMIKMCISKAHISKSVENLKLRHFIYLKEDEKDHRIYHLKITERACEVIKEFSLIHDECLAIIMNGISDEDKETIKRVMKKVFDNVNRELGEF